MTQTGVEQGQEDSGYDEGLGGGPGAPMPLSQLAVRYVKNAPEASANVLSGTRWIDCA